MTICSHYKKSEDDKMKRVSILSLGWFLIASPAFADKKMNVKDWFYTTPMSQECDTNQGWVSEEPAVKHVISYQKSWGLEGEMTNYTFYKVMCYAAPYNTSYVIVAEDEFSDHGYKILNFAVPLVNYVMEKELSNEVGYEVDVIESWSLKGFYTTTLIDEAYYEEDAKTITTYSRGRGVGDSYYSNIYTFNEGQWILTKSIQDPTFDEKMTDTVVFEIAD